MKGSKLLDDLIREAVGVYCQTADRRQLKGILYKRPDLEPQIRQALEDEFKKAGLDAEDLKDAMDHIKKEYPVTVYWEPEKERGHVSGNGGWIFDSEEGEARDEFISRIEREGMTVSGHSK